MKIKNYLAVGLLFATHLALQAQPQRLNLAQCVALAQENSLQLKGGELAVVRAQLLQKTAFELNKTDITLGQDLTSGGNPDNGISVSQSFDCPSVYKARRRYLEAETTVASSELGVIRNELIKSVTENYYAWVHAHHTLAILQRQDTIYRQFEQLACIRYKAGETNSLEVMNAQRLISENQMEMKKALRSSQSYLLNLQQLLNTDTELLPADTILVPLPLPESPAPDFSTTPWGRNFQARIASSERSVELAKQDFKPSFSVVFTWQACIKGLNPYNVDRERFTKGDFLAFEIGVSVPIFRGSQRAKVRAAGKEVELLRNQQLQAEQQLKGDRRTAYNQYCRAKETMEYYQRQGIDQARSMADLSRVEYEQGEIGYVEYMQNQIAALDVQMRYADAVNEYNQAIINLNYINANN